MRILLTKESVLATILAILYSSPIAFRLGSSGGLPIEIAISTLLIPYILTVFLIQRSIPYTTFSLFSFPLYFIVFGISASLFHGGSTQVLFSTVSFTIPLLHLPIGAWLYRTKIGRDFSFTTFSYAIIGTSFALVFSDIIFGSLPRGCGYEGRWGGCIGILEVYGFPNASMNYISVFSVLIGLILISDCGRLSKSIAWISMALIGALCALSLSRSALLIYLISTCFVLYATLGWRIFALAVPFSSLTYIYMDRLIGSLLFSGTASRVSAAVNSGDISTGRIGIWRNAVEAISESPVFGYGFFSFSKISEFGTVHQQYLEVLYKTGILGFAIYFLPLCLGVISFYKVNKVNGSKKLSRRKRIIFIGFSVGTFIANLFQPLISYQVFGGLIFFASGFFIAKARARGLS